MKSLRRNCHCEERTLPSAPPDDVDFRLRTSSNGYAILEIMTGPHRPFTGLARETHVDSTTAIQLRLNGAEFLADHSGALVWPDKRTLAVADLHLEKGSSYARHGTQLPPYDTRTTLDRLAEVLARYRPETVICVGDSFHDVHAADRLSTDDQTRLSRLIESRDWIWIGGNHDPAPPAAWGGRSESVWMIGPVVFRHEADPRSAAGEVSGHFHPKAGLSVRGRHISGRCFVSDGRRLILPAFGAYAGGLDVRDAAIAGLFRTGFFAYLIGRSGLLKIPYAARADTD